MNIMMSGLCLLLAVLHASVAFGGVVFGKKPISWAYPLLFFTAISSGLAALLYPL